MLRFGTLKPGLQEMRLKRKLQGKRENTVPEGKEIRLRLLDCRLAKNFIYFLVRNGQGTMQGFPTHSLNHHGTFTEIDDLLECYLQ